MVLWVVWFGLLLCVAVAFGIVSFALRSMADLTGYVCLISIRLLYNPFDACIQQVAQTVALTLTPLQIVVPLPSFPFAFGLGGVVGALEPESESAITHLAK